jgi:hypothetical protein
MNKSANILKHCTRPWRKRTLISTPTEGWIRYEWAAARHSQIIPMNWEASGYDPIGHSIDDAYNSIVKRALDMKVDWLITIEDDVLIPPDTFSKFEKYIRDEDIPIVSGLYYLKASPTLPLIFKGRGNGAFTKFKPGEKVWCDGLPMGCLLIHTSILKWFYDRTEEYTTGAGEIVRKVFETPQRVFIDPETMSYGRQGGTQDLYFFDRMLEHNVLKETGWKKVARKEFPLLCDTSIYCKHIDRQTGRQYP